MCVKLCMFFIGTLLILVNCPNANAARRSSPTPSKGKTCEKSCFINRVHRMMSADCFNRTCKRFPNDLQSNIEVIDASFNRIREITADDLKPYSSLLYLYLSENMITKIHPDAFLEQTELLALDLAYNAFSSPAAIPDVIFHLPSLKHLYLSQNQNINIVEVIERAAPIRAPLEHLDISYNNYEEEEWHTLPVMGIVPTLIKYNVTGMNVILNTSQFAGLCNLEVWVNANVTMEFVDPCECWNLDNWLKERHVHYENFTKQCTINQNECLNEVPERDLEIFTSCKTQHAEHVYQRKLNKSLVIGGASFLIVFIVLLIILWRWRRTRIRHRRVARNILHQDELTLKNPAA